MVLWNWPRSRVLGNKSAARGGGNGGGSGGGSGGGKGGGGGGGGGGGKGGGGAAAGGIAVGQFAKRTSTGTQSITGLTFRPIAIIFWVENTQAVTTFYGTERTVVGFAAENGGSVAQYAVSNASDNGGVASNNGVASFVSALGEANAGGTTEWVATVSMTNTGFDLNWTTANPFPLLVNYMALGSPLITTAKVIEWTFNAGTTGNKSATGVGFKPDVVFITSAGGGAAPITGTYGFLTLGVMDGSGNQWGIDVGGQDAQNFTNTARLQRTDQVFTHVNYTPSVFGLANFVSMDSDGFTVNVSDASSNMSSYALCIKGGHWKAGTFNKSTSGAPASQTVSSIGFTPTGLLLFSCQSVTATTGADHSRYGIGFATSSGQVAHAMTDTDNLDTPHVQCYSTAAACFVKVDNDTPVVDALATLTSFGSDNFILNWTTNDAVATEMLYLAVGP